MSGRIKVQFLGGSDEVGNLAMFMETEEGIRLLFEYGMSPGKPPKFPLPPPSVDLVLLTHAHLDHSGMIPWLCSKENHTIFATELTNKISTLLFKDSVKIAKMEGYALPYDQRDIKESTHCFTSVNPSEKIEKGINHEICFHSAGHIPGSLMFELIGSKKILFTGDMNVINTRLLNGCKPVPCDILFLEGTYAGRNHPTRSTLEKNFLEKIDEVVSRGGIAVVPTFAVSRCQELALVLKDAGFNTWLDGMGKTVSKIFLKYPRYLKSADELKNALNQLNFIHSDTGRKRALNSEVILTSSGMMDGGPVLWYMNHLKHDPKSAVLLTGYQVDGTNAHLLKNEGKLDFYGVIQKVECEVAYFDFSAHAGHSDLVRFAKGCKPDQIVLYHSDDRVPLVEPLSDFSTVYTPKDRELVEL